MNKILRRLWTLLSATLLCFVAINFAAAQDARPVHRVLIVYENESTQVAAVEIARGLRAGLDESFPTRFELYTEYLDNARFPQPGNLDRMAAHLTAKYGKLPLDVVITAGPAALRFMLAHRQEIAPGTPLLFGAVSAATAGTMNLPPDVRGVASHYDVQRTMQFARRLHPAASKAVVITGEAAFDRDWQQTARRALGDSFAGFSIDYVTGLTLEGYLEMVGRLSPDTVVLVLSIYEAADGRKYVPREAARRIAGVSNAPVYVVYDSFLGAGAVGGYMDTFEGVGATLAVLASKTFAGETGGPQIVDSPAHPVVDWRQIVRWSVPPDLVPGDTEIRFRTPSVWEQYRTEILATIAVILFQSLLITALIIQAQRTRKAQQELEVGRLELTHLSRTSLLGELSGAFAHELNQPLTAILANAEVGRRLLDQREPDIAEVKEILGEIAVDDKRAAEIIGQLRSLLVKGEAKLQPVDLNQVVTATLALAGSELLVRRVRAEFRRELPEAMALGSFAQLQQIVLNLIVNAADAMSQLPPDRRIVEITVRNGADGRYEVAVSDNGPGLTLEMMEKAFRPFVSSKSNGLGLGLAICRTIALAHQGTLDFDQTRGSGARIVLSLPRHGSQP